MCRVCDSSNGRSFSANGYRWFECKNCGALQKELTHDQYLALKPTYDPGAFLDSASREEIERFLGLDDNKKLLKRLVPNRLLSDSRDRSFLDIGCGMGGYLLAAQSFGFSIQGFEPSSDHANVAKTHLRLPVIADYFSRQRVGNRAFDVIMLSHVIEHIYSPKEFLHEVISVLKPGGVLIVITPNADSLLARWTGRHWPMLKPVDHVTMLSAKTYSSFGLDDMADVQHHFSEYPFEFAATVAAILKATARRQASSSGNGRADANQPPPLRAFDMRAQILKSVLTIASAPFWLLASATHRQACLVSVIVRKP